MEIIREYLSEHGYKKDKIKEIIGGFDLSKSVYRNTIESGSEVYQFIRRSSANAPLPNIGNWFCLTGATMNGLAIISGGEGREIADVKVTMNIDVLEGIAAPQSKNWKWSGGGDGGNTQIFIPHKYLASHICVLGYRVNQTGEVTKA